MLNNWELSGITTATSGAPTQMTLTINGVNTGQLLMGNLFDRAESLPLAEPRGFPAVCRSISRGLRGCHGSRLSPEKPIPSR